MTQTTPGTNPRRGGSYVRHKDGKLERLQWTEPRKERAGPEPGPGPSPKGGGGQNAASKSVKETSNG